MQANGIVLKTVRLLLMVKAFVVIPSGMISSLHRRKNQTLSAVKKRAGVQSQRFYCLGKNVNHSGEECLCAWCISAEKLLPIQCVLLFC